MKQEILIMKKIISVMSVILLFLMLTACSDKNGDSHFYDEYPTGSEIVTVEVKKNPTATIKFENGSEIELELHYETAPNAVADFIALAREGVYDGVALDQVRNNCIIMLGAADGAFKAPYYVMDEINTGDNKLSHTAGVVSMVRESKSNSLTGQFFILTKDQTHFDSMFTSFGTITSGMDVVEQLAASEKDDRGYLTSPYTIKSVSVKTYGVKFPNPTIIPIEEEN